jgi:hypothetical protein
MTGSAIRRLLLAMVASAVALTGCGSSSPSASPGSTSSAAGQATLGPRTGLEHSVYFLVADSSGTKPAEGSWVTLLFEPGGAAIVSARSATDALAHHGTWSYQGGTLVLKFTAEDLTVDASFALSLGDNSVTMPFQVFSADAGSSTWSRGQMSLVSEAFEVFEAAAFDPDRTASLTADEAVEEAYRVAVDRVAVGGDLETDIVASGNQLEMMTARLERQARSGPRLAEADSDAPTIAGVVKLANGIRIDYLDGPPITVPLYDWLADTEDHTPLTVSQLALDPRVHLNVETPVSGKDDPAYKTAVIIAPFENGRYYANQWLPEPGAQPAFENEWDDVADKMEDHGYAVTQLEDEDATLVEIIKALGGRSGRAPGVVVFDTHGSPGGVMATGAHLGRVGDPSVRGAFKAAMAELSEAGFDGLLTFDGGTRSKPKTIGVMALKREGGGGISDFFLTLAPPFWEWLNITAPFDRSMVFAEACWSDATPDLREAIEARAFFGWARPTTNWLGRAIVKYIVDDLVRPTHTSEEAYYNLFRVAATRQQIYKEDAGLQDVIPESLSERTAFLDYFRGWGWDGANLMPYGTSGWLDRTMNPGSVWYLLFAGRWGGDAFNGGTKLVRCWKDYWARGSPGGMADPNCNAAHPGQVTQDEVGYATYLLTGSQMLAYARTPVPRFTLNDGG